jgi:hypothetical protein
MLPDFWRLVFHKVKVRSTCVDEDFKKLVDVSHGIRGVVTGELNGQIVLPRAVLSHGLLLIRPRNGFICRNELLVVKASQ